MPTFHRIKTARGWVMREVPNVEPPKAEPIHHPLSTTVGEGTGFKRYSCTACSPVKPFAAPGVASMHFNKAHKDMVHDKDSWRKWIKENLTGEL